LLRIISGFSEATTRVVSVSIEFKNPEFIRNNRLRKAF